MNNVTTTEEYPSVRHQAWNDEQIVERIVAGDSSLFELLMRRHNQRVYRTARAILGSDLEAEDVMQETYVRAYQHLAEFEGRARFSTWLTRIAIHEALARRRKHSHQESIDALPEWERNSMEASLTRPAPDPERQAFGHEIGRLIEDAVESLPGTYRVVFVLRDVEQMDTAEAAAALDLTEQAVKVRLHRARGLLRRALHKKLGDASPHAFEFHAPRCDRVVAAVMTRLAPRSSPHPSC